ncbi:carbohydrate ABC transporter permease [Clostridium sp. MB05]|jgi:raffinose/stachyose/melibiose transport system permease protein|uniref:carbohydrate ABC transporter permease n=1 Tax=Clostridium sp. MB05 TaxID=3376682 RepID=UPI003981CF0A
MTNSGFKRNNLWRTPLAILICLLHIIPFYILVGVAFKSPKDLSSRWVFPTYINWENFSVAIEKGKIGQSLMSSLVITSVSIVFITIIGALAAYPLARNRTKFNMGVKAFVLGIMMVPPLSILVPLYSMIAKLNGTSTYWSIIIVLITFQLPMSIFLYTNFISSIPDALDEAAAIDGCGPIRTFFSIILPQLKPVTATVVILTGVSCWNDYQFSLYLLQSPKIKTVTQAIAGFFSQSSSNINAAAAASLLGILPIVIIFLCLQKYFIKGMVDSAIK